MPSAPSSAVFESSHEFEFFDYFRVPYAVQSEGLGLECLDGRLGVLRPLTPMSGDRRLVWWRGGPNQTAATRAGRFRLAGFTIAAHVVEVGPDDLLENLGHGWQRLDGIVDGDGNEVAAVWESAEGAVFLPFDPGEVMLNFWSERYTTLGRRGVGRAARSAMLRTYYLVRPLLPRRLQIMLRKIFAKQQGVPEFPRWPLETSLHDMYEWLFDLLTSIAEAPVPWIDVWPTGKSWAFVLTHDVETAGVSPVASCCAHPNAGTDSDRRGTLYPSVTTWIRTWFGSCGPKIARSVSMGCGMTDATWRRDACFRNGCRRCEQPLTAGRRRGSDRLPRNGAGN